MSLQWQRTPSEAIGDLADWQIDAIQRGLAQIAERRAQEIEDFMKRNAPWTDRTGEARAGLIADVFEIAQQAVVLVMSYGPDTYYGVYLELAHGGSYSILMPTLDRYIPVIWQDVQQLLGV